MEIPRGSWQVRILRTVEVRDERGNPITYEEGVVTVLPAMVARQLVLQGVAVRELAFEEMGSAGRRFV
jgi:hypothetical protein